jgi:hypothetical protein
MITGKDIEDLKEEHGFKEHTQKSVFSTKTPSLINLCISNVEKFTELLKLIEPFMVNAPTSASKNKKT